MNALYPSSDLVSTSLTAATIVMWAAAVLCALGLSWTSERWRVTLALSAIALLAGGLVYLQSIGIWQAHGKLTAAPRYAGMYTLAPALVAAVFFYARQAGKVPIGIFWRTVVAAILMVFSRYLGDAGAFNATLGVLLSIAFWLYILGEMYFGSMSEAIRKASRPIRLGYFWVRLIMTIGWAIYPILYFVDLVAGAGHTYSIIVLYTIADVINFVTVPLIFVSVAGLERY